MREFSEDSLSGFASYFRSNLLGGPLHFLVGRPEGVLEVRRRLAVEGLLRGGLGRSEENGDGDDDDANELGTESEKIIFLCFLITGYSISTTKSTRFSTFWRGRNHGRGAGRTISICGTGGHNLTAKCRPTAGTVYSNGPKNSSNFF